MSMNPKNVLDAVLKSWNREAGNWSSQHLSSLYTKDALFFGGRTGQSVGGEEITAYFNSYFGVILSANLKLVEQHILSLSDDCIVAQGFGEFDFVLQGNKSTHSRLRTTLVICKVGDEWKIRVHHFSTIPEAPPLGD